MTAHAPKIGRRSWRRLIRRGHLVARSVLQCDRHRQRVHGLVHVALDHGVGKRVHAAVVGEVCRDDAVDGGGRGGAERAADFRAWLRAGKTPAQAMQKTIINMPGSTGPLNTVDAATVRLRPLKQLTTP